MTPPEPLEDAPAGDSEPSYERVFTDLLRRFWRLDPAVEPAKTAPDPSTDITPEI